MAANHLAILLQVLRLLLLLLGVLLVLARLLTTVSSADVAEVVHTLVSDVAVDLFNSVHLPALLSGFHSNDFRVQSTVRAEGDREHICFHLDIRKPNVFVPRAAAQQFVPKLFGNQKTARS